MKKDWVIWGGCFLLFFAGVIWGMIPDKAGFFLVENVHDLFEIVSAIATVAAAIFAYFAWNSWRSQFALQEGFKAATEVCALMSEVGSLCRLLEFAAMNCEPRPGNLSDEDVVKIIESRDETQRRWDDVLIRFANSFYAVEALCGEEIMKGIPITPRFLYLMTSVVSSSRNFPNYEGKSEYIRKMKMDVLGKVNESHRLAGEARKKIAYKINKNAPTC